MSNLINTNYALSNINRSVSVSTPKQIRFRGNSDYETASVNNNAETKNKSNGKTFGIITLIVLAAAATFGGFCVKKGAKVLEGKDATLKEKFSQGWKEFFGKGKKVAEETANNVNKAKEDITKKGEEAANNVAKNSAPETEIAKETVEKQKPAENIADEIAKKKETIIPKQDYDKFLKNFSAEDRACVEAQVEELNNIGISAMFKETKKGTVLEIKATEKFADTMSEITGIPKEYFDEAKQTFKDLNYEIKCNNIDEYMDGVIKYLNGTAQKSWTELLKGSFPDVNGKDVDKIIKQLFKN